MTIPEGRDYSGRIELASKSLIHLSDFPDLGSAACHHRNVLKRTLNGSGKGWFAGPWDSSLAIAVGYSDIGVDEQHRHDTMHEVYLVACGSSTARIDGETVELTVGDMLVVEPGEIHSFIASSPDYLHFVVQTPFVRGDKMIATVVP